MTDPILDDLRKKYAEIAREIEKQERAQVDDLVAELNSLGYDVVLTDKSGKTVDLSSVKAATTGTRTRGKTEGIVYHFTGSEPVILKGNPSAPFINAALKANLMPLLDAKGKPVATNGKGNAVPMDAATRERYTKNLKSMADRAEKLKASRPAKKPKAK